MKGEIKQPKHELSKLYCDSNGRIHSDQWFIIEGVAGIELDRIVFNIYFLTYCI
jgi:hypothetical protein